MVKPIVIQGALQSEIDKLLEIVEIEKETYVGNFLFYECMYKNYPIVISKTKMGEISCAISTTIAIQKYNPLFILNQGTAGAFVDWLDIGDIIVGKEVYYISQFSTDEAKEKDSINPWKNFGYNTIDNEFTAYKANEELIGWIKNLEFIKNKRTYFDVIGSGDVWTKDIEQMKMYNAKYGVVCEAMEVSGAYLTANSFGIPLVSIRVISNNEIKNQSYDEKYGVLSQEYIINIIDEFVNSL
jgi:adenosylhomocysteine nucleosidase